MFKKSVGWCKIEKAPVQTGLDLEAMELIRQKNYTIHLPSHQLHCFNLKHMRVKECDHQI